MKKKRLLFVLPAAVLALGACTPVEGGGQYGPDQPGPVQPTEKTLESISVKSQPTKTEYLPGEAFDPAGLAIELHYSDGSKADADMSKVVYGEMPAASGNLTVSYVEGGVSKSTVVAVTIKTDAALQSVTIEGELTKTEYEVGEAFSTAGLSIVGHYSDGSTAALAGEIEVDPEVAAKGVTSITVTATAGGITASKQFSVTVNEPYVPPVVDPTFEEAYRAAEALESGETDEYELTGVVSATQGNTFFLQNGSLSIEVYNKTIDGAAAIVGKEVTVLATLQNYYGTVETKTITSAEYTGEDGSVTPKPISTKAQLDSENVNILIAPAELTYRNAQKEFDAKNSDGIYNVEIGGEAVTLFVSKHSLNRSVDILKEVLDGGVINVDTAIVGINKGVKQIIISDQSVITKGGVVPPAPQEVDHIAIEGTATKIEYVEGEAYSADGLHVEAYYVNGEHESVSARIVPEKATAELGDTSIKFTASFAEKEAEKTVNVTVCEKQAKNYGSEEHPLTVSEALAIITEECPADKDMTAEAITVEGEIAVIKNTFTYESGPCFEFDITDGVSTVYVYRCHCTEEQASSVVAGATVKLVGYAKNFKNTLEFVDNGATQCHVLSIGSVTPPTPLKEVDHIAIEGTPSKTEYVEGEAYSAAGLHVEVYYKDGNHEAVSGVSIVPEKANAALGDTSIKFTASYSEKDAEKTVNVTVSEKQTKNYGTEDKPLTVSEALAIITEECVADKDMTAEAITVQGEIAVIKNTFTYESGPCFEFDITDGTSTVYVYRCHCTEEQASSVVAGATVKLVGYAKNFKNTLEFVDNGATQCHVLSIGSVTPPTPLKEVDHIAIEGTPSKTEYVEGEAYSAAGLHVEVYYKDGNHEAASGVSIVPEKANAALGDTSIKFTATYSEKDAEKTVNVTVTQGEVPPTPGKVIEVDTTYVLTAESLGLESSYGSGKNNDVEWADLCKNTECIQGNYKVDDKTKEVVYDSEIHNLLAFSKEIKYVKLSVGKASGVNATGEVRFGSSALPTGNSVAYGKDTSYSLTEVGAFVIPAPAGSTYFSLKWISGAAYFSSIEIGFEEYQGSHVQSIALNKTSTSITEGGTETLNVTFTPTDVTEKGINWVSSATDVATVDATGKVTAVAKGTAVITATSVDGGKTATCTVTVTEKVDTGLTPLDLGGSAKVVYGGVEYDKSIKAGTGKVAGTADIVVPEGATKLVFFIAGWNKEEVTVSVVGGSINQSIDLTSDSGVSGNGPFTISSTDDSLFKVEIDLSGESGEVTLSLTATSGLRFVVWNAGYEE